MTLKLGLLALLLLFVAACHSQTRWAWRSSAQPLSAGPVALTVAAPGLRAVEASAWSPVLEKIIAGQAHMRLDRQAWEYSVWVSVDRETLSLTIIDRQNRILVATSVRDTHFSDRQTGRALPAAAEHAVAALRGLLFESFPAPAIATNAAVKNATGGGK